MENRVHEILEFWFGVEPSDEAVIREKGASWFSSSPELDAEIKQRFGADVEKAASGEYNSWLEIPKRRLAAIILLDQFTRNIYRGTAQAFATDHLALKWAREGIAAGLDQELRPIERSFFYMPLMHAEELEAQDQCIRLFEALVAETDGELSKNFENNLRFSHLHRDLIVEFGRFPYRNSTLGRESTPEELAHLAQSTQSFGQSKH